MTSNLTRRIAGGLAVVALGMSAAACGGSTATTASVASAPAASATAAPTVAPTTAASAAPSATAAASVGTTGRLEFKDKGFAVTLPTGWTRINLESGDLDALMKAAGASNPALAQAYTAQIKAMLASGLVLFAFGPNPATGTNVNILVVPSLGVSMDLLEQASVAQVKALANTDVAADRVTLPAGQAIHLKYGLATANLPSGASVEQYVLLTDRSQFVVSVTNAAPDDAQAIAQSIELLK